MMLGHVAIDQGILSQRWCCLFDEETDCVAAFVHSICKELACFFCVFF